MPFRDIYRRNGYDLIFAWKGREGWKECECESKRDELKETPDSVLSESLLDITFSFFHSCSILCGILFPCTPEKSLFLLSLWIFFFCYFSFYFTGQVKASYNY